MPLVAPAIKAKFKDRIFQGLKREFAPYYNKGEGYPPLAEDTLLKLANAISDIAMDIVDEVQQNAQVVPGQQVMIPATASPGAPSPGSVVSPGKII